MNTLTDKLLNTKLLSLLFSAIFPLLLFVCLDPGDRIDWLILYMVNAVGVFLLITNFKKLLKNPMILYIGLQFMFFWISLDINLDIPFKPHFIIFSLSSLVSIFYIFKYFKYLWSNYLFKFLLLFFVVNMIYILSSYYSGFLSSSSVDLMLFIKSNGLATRSFDPSEYKYLIYLTSLVPLIATMVSLLVFKDTKSLDEIKSKFMTIFKTSMLLFLAFNALSLICAAVNISPPEMTGIRMSWKFWPGTQMPTFFLGLFIIYYICCPNIFSNFSFKGTKWYFPVVSNLLIFLNMILIMLISVKTTIISAIFCIALLLFVLKMFNYRIDLFNIPTQGNGFILKILTTITLIAFLTVIIMNFDFFSHNLMTRFSNTATTTLRLQIWHNIALIWQDKLNWFTFLFGNGIDTSKEQAFLITNMFPKEDIVPNVHNSYVEMFYEYGMVALLFFGAILSVLFNNIKIILAKNSDSLLRFFSIASSIMIIYFLLFHTTDGVKIAVDFTFFSMIGLLESIKLSIKRLKTKEEILT